MRRHADVVEVLKHVFRNPVVEDPLALDHLMLLRIGGGRVILEVLNQSSRLGPLIEDLGLAFIDAATAVHGRVPWFVNVHAMPWVPEVWLSCPRLEGTRATRSKEREHARASLVATSPIGADSTIKDIVATFVPLTRVAEGDSTAPRNHSIR